MRKRVYGKAARDLEGREGEQGFSVYNAGVVDEDCGSPELCF